MNEDFKQIKKRCEDIDCLQKILNIIKENTVETLKENVYLKTISYLFESLNFGEGCITNKYFKHNKDLYSVGFWNMMTFYHFWCTDYGEKYKDFTLTLNNKLAKLFKKETVQNEFQSILNQEKWEIGKFLTKGTNDLSIEIKNWINNVPTDYEPDSYKIHECLVDLDNKIRETKQELLKKEHPNLTENEIELLSDRFNKVPDKKKTDNVKAREKIKEKTHLSQKLKQKETEIIETYVNENKNKAIWEHFDESKIKQFIEETLASEIFINESKNLSKFFDQRIIADAKSFYLLGINLETFDELIKQANYSKLHQNLTCLHNIEIRDLMKETVQEYKSFKETFFRNNINTFENEKTFQKFCAYLYEENEEVLPENVKNLRVKLNYIRLKKHFPKLMEKLKDDKTFNDKLEKLISDTGIRNKNFNFEDEDFFEIKRIMQGLYEYYQLEIFNKISKGNISDDTLLLHIIQSREVLKLFISDIFLLKHDGKYLNDCKTEITTYRDYLAHKTENFIYIKADEEIFDVQKQINQSIIETITKLQGSLKSRFVTIEDLFKKKDPEELCFMLSFRSESFVKLTCKDWTKMDNDENTTKDVTDSIKNFKNECWFSYSKICKDLNYIIIK